jgi:hypothetical protein
VLFFIPDMAISAAGNQCSDDQFVTDAVIGLCAGKIANQTWSNFTNSNMTASPAGLCL